MCWRDDVVTTRFCSECGQAYYGDLGHRGCRGRVISAEEKLRGEKIEAVGVRHKWDGPTTHEKIKLTGEILGLNEENAIIFLLKAIPDTQQNVIDKLEEDHPPF